VQVSNKSFLDQTRDSESPVKKTESYEIIKDLKKYQTSKDKIGQSIGMYTNFNNKNKQ